LSVVWFGFQLLFDDINLFWQFFPTAEESINYYNQKRCVDGKGLVLPSQIVIFFTFTP
jgi:phosphatidylinositol-3,4,5-trisphosphate 3-phosphatase/dual-specificity protein phosphatase PTEN